MALGIHPDVLEWLENGEAAKLCGCGEKQVLHFFYHDPIGDYSMEGNGHWTPKTSREFQICVECSCCMTGGAVVTTKEAADEIQVVVSLDGGLVQDLWAFTEESLAVAKQAEQDKIYGIERDEQGMQTDDGNDAQVITYLLRLDSDEGSLGEVPSPSDIEPSFMAAEGMGPTSDIMAPMTSEDEQSARPAEACILSPMDVQDLLDFITEAEDKGADLKEVERVRAILGYPIP